MPGYFDAVIMENDYSAAVLCKPLKGVGLSVPGDVGVIGSDNDEICSFCTPELSSIDDEEYLKASSLVKMLLDIIESNRSPHIYQSITLHSKLIIRESSSRRQDKTTAML